MKALLLLSLFTACLFTAPAQKITTRNDFKKFFDEYGVKGSISIYDLKADKYILYNKAQFKQQFIPASTFKIYNSLIGLQTGVIPDENYVIKWDGVKHDNEEWNKDQTLESAFKVSAYWYYQELARRVGSNLMNLWIKKIKYGNQNIGGGIDQFWLHGNLRITPREQINLLRKLYSGSLPFSKRNMDIVKRIMIQQKTDEYTLRGKTGWAQTETRKKEIKENTGWFTGYVETKDNVYFFATCVQYTGTENKNFIKCRKEISLKALKELGIIK